MSPLKEARKYEKAADKITIRYARKGGPVHPEDNAEWQKLIDKSSRLRRLAQRTSAN